MFIERKRMSSIIAFVLGLVCLALMGTPCYNYAGSIGSKGYYTLFEFGKIYNDGLMAMGICLLSFVCILICYNVLALFIKKIEYKFHSLVDMGLWLLIIAFAIACLCSKRFNIAIATTNSLVFILITAIIGLGGSLFVLAKPEPEK